MHPATANQLRNALSCPWSPLSSTARYFFQTSTRIPTLSPYARHATAATATSSPSPSPPSLSPSQPSPRPLPPSLTPSHTRTKPVPARKAHLLQIYKSLLTENEVALFVSHADFDAKEWRDLRGKIEKLSVTSAGGGAGGESVPMAKLTVLRTGLLPPLLRELYASPSESSPTSSDPTRLLPLFKSLTRLGGPLAIITLKSFDPPSTLQKLVTLIDRTSKLPNPRLLPSHPAFHIASASKPTSEVLKAHPPSRSPVMGSVVMGQGVLGWNRKELERFGKMDGLDVVRGKLVGLVEMMRGGRLVGVIGARGGEVMRTVEGFKQGLEEKQEGNEGKGA